MLPSLAQIQDALSDRGLSHVHPVVRLNVRDAPAEIYLNLENLHPIGSFKIRVATNTMCRMVPEVPARGILTALGGNMAQGVACGVRASFGHWIRQKAPFNWPSVDQSYLDPIQDDLHI